MCTRIFADLKQIYFIQDPLIIFRTTHVDFGRKTTGR